MSRCYVNKTTIQTHSGHFDLANPSPDDVRIEDIAHSLARLCRFVGHVRSFYSVAQHSCLVSMYCPPEARLEALLHDAGEAYYGDWSSPLKRCFSGNHERDISSVMAGVDRAIADRFGLTGEHAEVVRTLDLRLLATEKRDLFVTDCDAWAAWTLPSPLHMNIFPWPDCETAEWRFLAAFNELVGKKERNGRVDQIRESAGARATSVC